MEKDKKDRLHKITLSSEDMPEIDWTELCLAFEISPELCFVKFEAKIIETG